MKRNPKVRPPASKPDAALATAIEILDGQVCECGHLVSEHFIPAPQACNYCDCKAFEVVEFVVTRR